jgi:hypothetical protein
MRSGPVRAPQPSSSGQEKHWSAAKGGELWTSKNISLDERLITLERANRRMKPVGLPLVAALVTTGATVKTVSTKEEVSMRNRKSIVLTTTFVLAALLIGSGVATAKAKTVAALAGTWAGYGDVTYVICFNSTYTALANCSDAGANPVPFSQSEVFQATVDTSGNACYTVFFTNSAEFPNPGTPAHNASQILAVTTTGYDPSTQIVQASVTSYDSEPGVSCNGSVLVNTANEAPAETGTTTGVVSQSGSQIDTIVNTVAASPISYLGNYVGHTVEFRQ